MNLEKVPEADMWTVAKSSQINRRAVLGFVPRGLKVVDYGELDRIDRFYLECQDYRDYYRDPYDKLHKPIKFQYFTGSCGIRPDTSVELLRQPIQWVPKRQPPLLPIDFKSDMRLGMPIGDITMGRYGKESCCLYKR